MGKLDFFFSSDVCTKDRPFLQCFLVPICFDIHSTYTYGACAMCQTLGWGRDVVKRQALLDHSNGVQGRCRHSKQPMNEWVHEVNSEWQGLGEDKQHNITVATLPLQRVSQLVLFMNYESFTKWLSVPPRCGVDTLEACVCICTCSWVPLEFSAWLHWIRPRIWRTPLTPVDFVSTVAFNLSSSFEKDKHKSFSQYIL